VAIDGAPLPPAPAATVSHSSDGSNDDRSRFSGFARRVVHGFRSPFRVGRAAARRVRARSTAWRTVQGVSAVSTLAEEVWLSRPCWSLLRVSRADDEAKMPAAHPKALLRVLAAAKPAMVAPRPAIAHSDGMSSDSAFANPRHFEEPPFRRRPLGRTPAAAESRASDYSHSAACPPGEAPRWC
jgi:hypothetical protein